MILDMSQMQRVTVSLPGALLREVDQCSENRSAFVQQALRRELARRDREELAISLSNPHPDSVVMAEAGLGEWPLGVSDEEAAGLVDPSEVVPMSWQEGVGWRER